MPTDTSGGLPILEQQLRLGELVATLALAQDNAFGQPLESQLRSCLLATWISEAAGFDQELRETTYWVSLLRYIGCTGHAHEVATLFGDEQREKVELPRPELEFRAPGEGTPRLEIDGHATRFEPMWDRRFGVRLVAPQ